MRQVLVLAAGRLGDRADGFLLELDGHDGYDGG